MNEGVQLSLERAIMCCLQFDDDYYYFMYTHQTQVSLTVGVRVENVVQIWKTPPNANGPFSLL